MLAPSVTDATGTGVKRPAASLSGSTDAANGSGTAVAGPAGGASANTGTVAVYKEMAWIASTLSKPELLVGCGERCCPRRNQIEGRRVSRDGRWHVRWRPPQATPLCGGGHGTRTRHMRDCKPIPIELHAAVRVHGTRAGPQCRPRWRGCAQHEASADFHFSGFGGRMCLGAAAGVRCTPLTPGPMHFKTRPQNGGLGLHSAQRGCRAACQAWLVSGPLRGAALAVPLSA